MKKFARPARFTCLTPFIKLPLTWLSLGLSIGLIFTGSELVAAEAESAKAITGTVKVAPSLKDKIAPSAALYIIARQDGVTAGPPMAVQRFAPPLHFPIRFEMTSKDAMMPDTPFRGKFSLIARVAQKGSATPANAGDLQTSKPLAGVEAGGKSVTLEIDEVRK